MASSRNSPPDDPIVAVLGNCLARNVQSGQRLVVGYSGGLDSTVLLHALIPLANEIGCDLAALHVHHGLSRNADEWSRHCTATCAAWRVRITIEAVVVERGSADGLEAAARRARHRAFANVDAAWVVLAHHANDQAETLLFNLLRGAGLKGASAMTETNGRLLRPLLGVTRADIAAYANRHALGWIEDESNDDRSLSRNHLRHDVLAGLEQRFPGSTGNLAAAARRFREAQGLLDDLACHDLGGEDADFPVAVATLTALSEPRARNALRYLLHQHHVGIASEERLREALAQMLHAAPDRHPAVRFGTHVLRRVRRQIVLEPQED